MLPLLCFGVLTTEEKYIEQAKARNEPQEFPSIPGVFSLQPPYEKVVLILSDNCPARYVNDCRGVRGAKPNIMFVQHPDPRQLFHDNYKGIHLLLQAQCTRDIEAGEQLYTPYGDKFWNEKAPIYRANIDEAKLLEPGEMKEGNEGKDDVDIDLTNQDETKEVTPRRQRTLNLSTLTQDALMMSSPLTPLKSPSEIDASTVLDDEEPEQEKENETSSTGKRKKRNKANEANESSSKKYKPGLNTPPTKTNKISASKFSSSKSSSSKSSAKSSAKSSSSTKKIQNKKKFATLSDEDTSAIPYSELDPAGLEVLRAAETLRCEFTIKLVVTLFFFLTISFLAKEYQRQRQHELLLLIGILLFFILT